jgi:hypothetical protein
VNYRIIGSVAMYHWFPDARVPSDIDLLTPAQISGNDSKVCVVDVSWHRAAQELIDANKDPVFLDPDLLFTLKLSHAEWNVKWEKTMADISFLKRKGCKINYRLLRILKEVWEEVHGKKRVNMAKTMDTFFKDAVKREYDHEYLHLLVAFNDRPMHEELRADHNTAWCSRELFEQLPVEQQFETALEEMMAVAIERSRLKEANKVSEKRIAMSRAHFQLCTSMTKGWFAEFLILNRNELLHERKDKWMTKMDAALQALEAK